ncbi:hypothetical protein [Stenotrophomonas lactitubi]|uniref:hypothetical protein n=1 Tax=Stenotrophomonas lactitubi TaxID=2045214 RepID=UPI003208F38F
MTKFLIAVMLIGAGLGFSSGTSAVGKRPFKMVQFCVHDQQGMNNFKKTLGDMATAERMQFFDRSAALERHLAKSNVNLSRPVVYVGVKREDGSGLEAGNLGLDRFEIAIGFSEGERPTEAMSFSVRVERTLSQRWKVIAIPSDSGATPLACRTGAPTASKH